MKKDYSEYQPSETEKYHYWHGNSREARFDWGTVRLDYTLADGVIAEAALWSDGLEADYLSAVPALLRGCALTPQALAARLAPTAPDASVARDLAGLVLQKEE